MTTYDALSDDSKVWIYQSNRPFLPEETKTIQLQLLVFTRQWVSHNQQLKAFGKLYHNQFVVLMVDQSQAGASGCSIDSSVNFIKRLEQEVGTNFFDRLNFAFWEDGQIRTAHKKDFSELHAAGRISDETIVFDNLVSTKADFEAAWNVPLKDSWHKRFV